MKNNSSKIEKTIYILVSIWGLFLIASYAYGGLYPNAKNWGFHSMGFMPKYFLFSMLFIMLIILIPKVQSAVISFVDYMITHYKSINNYKKKSIFLVLLLMSGILFWIAREKTFFLGDGYLVLRNLSSISNINLTSATVFGREPLTGVLVSRFFDLLKMLKITTDETTAIQFFNVLIGCGFLFWLSKYISIFTKNIKEKLFGFLFIIVSGSTLLFFGYVENYTLPYFLSIVYISLSIAYLQGKVKIIYPSLLYGVLFCSYFVTIIFFPTLLLLYYYSVAQKKIKPVLLSLISTLSFTIVLLIICGFTPTIFISTFSDRSHFLPLFNITNQYESYTIFSFSHLIDLFNYYQLISPFSIFIGFLIFIFFVRRKLLKNFVLLFFFILLFCSFLFTFIVNCEVGMSRDWDLLSPVNLSLILLVLFIICNYFKDQLLKYRILVIISIFTSLHTFSWVYINAHENLSLNRINILANSELWSKHAISYYYDELASYYANKDDVKSSLKNHLEYIKIDSTNPRILRNIATAYHFLGDLLNAQNFYEKTIKYGTNDSTIYQQLGTIYYKFSNYKKVIEMEKNMLEINPNISTAYFTIGVCIIKDIDNYAEAVPYFKKAVIIDTNYSEGYLNLSTCYSKLSNYDSANYYFEKFLTLNPNHPLAKRAKKG